MRRHAEFGGQPRARRHLRIAVEARPMHAEANARYWAGLSNYEPTANNEGVNPVETDEKGTFNPSLLASHLQCDDKTARELRKGLLMGLPWIKGCQLARP